MFWNLANLKVHLLYYVIGDKKYTNLLTTRWKVASPMIIPHLKVLKKQGKMVPQSIKHIIVLRYLQAAASMLLCEGKGKLSISCYFVTCSDLLPWPGRVTTYYAVCALQKKNTEHRTTGVLSTSKNSSQIALKAHELCTLLSIEMVTGRHKFLRCQSTTSTNLQGAFWVFLHIKTQKKRKLNSW